MLMDEQQWLSCSDPMAMLEFLQNSGKASARKLRLFAIACSRRLWAQLEDIARAAVDVAEAYADGQAGPEELRAARLACRSAGESAAWYAAASSPFVAARNAALSAQAGLGPAESATQAEMLRDIFGPSPVGSVVIYPDWLTPKVVDLARSLYEENDFSTARMSILADALLDTACTAELLGHCRSEGHVRGCWLVDGLLGKS
jgi:hypothetical protein